MEPHDARSTHRFSDRAADYARCRPGYPGAAIDAMLEGLPEPTGLRAADIAAGTGLLSRALGDRGLTVVAVEPNAAMRAAARPHPNVTFVAGTAAATGLPAEAFDLVTVAQAFHWFGNATALAEFHRVLRPGGRLAILWNRRRRDDPFTLGYREALAAIDAEPPAERGRFDPAVVAADGLFAGLRTFAFGNPHPLSLELLIGLAMSTSTVPQSGAATDSLLATLRDLHVRHQGSDGYVTMRYRTDVFLWDRVDEVPASR
ncbi:MAG: methyltransferase domain-containing protein [Planctomycetes bacterium]|nr:methyltransferase domain-containing protein [Planctomycetota bacterium]